MGIIIRQLHRVPILGNILRVPWSLHREPLKEFFSNFLISLSPIILGALFIFLTDEHIPSTGGYLTGLFNSAVQSIDNGELFIYAMTSTYYS